MRIGIIGIGDICEKAYLPVITAMEGIELILCTRNTEKLHRVSKQYRIESFVTSVDELINMNIDGAFVHTSTETHVKIVEKLLSKGVHVYVDKPISYNYDDSLRVAELSKKYNKILMVGFNRRFAPMYRSLKDNGQAEIIVAQKNRVDLPNHIRTFILDDFIHVVDTLRFLMNGEVKDLKVNGLKKEELLSNVVVTLSNDRTTAIGIMNRDNGATEEVIEYMSSGNKLVVKDLVNTTQLKENKEMHLKFKDWDSTLYKRGFYDVIEEFISAIRNNTSPSITIEDALETHKLCEDIVKGLEKLS